MLATVKHILPVTIIRRERVIRGRGRLLVRKGQKVSATDVIVESSMHSDHIMIDVAQGLGVPVNKTQRLIHCQVDDQIHQGDLIAGPLGFMHRVIRSPQSGKILQISNGKILLETTSRTFQLLAGYPGIVVELIPDRGAIIEMTGALIQGVWGNGKINFGIMTNLSLEPDYSLVSKNLDVSLRGSVVSAAHCDDPEVLKAVDELPLRGLILASMSPALIPLAQKLIGSVIVLEGFGNQPMNPIGFKLLSTNDRRETSINAEFRQNNRGGRPEIVIPLPGTSNPNKPHMVRTFAPEQTIRITFGPQMGEVGTLLRVIDSATFPSGLHAPAGEIRVEGKIFIIPLANLEVLA